WGLDLGRIGAAFGRDYRETIEAGLDEFLEKGQVSKLDDLVTLTREGKLFADHIAAQLFVGPPNT
ncbi:MAG TPA: coproporphyrinogen III oxidase, partial [Sphingobacteriaceae bacterium]